MIGEIIGYRVELTLDDLLNDYAYTLYAEYLFIPIAL